MIKDEIFERIVASANKQTVEEILADVVKGLSLPESKALLTLLGNSEKCNNCHHLVELHERFDGDVVQCRCCDDCEGDVTIMHYE